MLRFIITLILILFLTDSVGAATYYVDTTRPNDLGDGLSEGAAWKTIAKVNSVSFNPGDSILFKKGQTWYESILPATSGSAGGGYITYGAYGSGANPIISRSNPYTNWWVWSTAGDNGGFERYTTDTPPAFKFSEQSSNYWSNDEWGTGVISAETASPIAGLASAKMTHGAAGSLGGDGCRMTTPAITTIASTAYTLKLTGYCSTAVGTDHLAVSVKDRGNNYYLQSNGTWANSGWTYCLNWDGVTTATEKTLAFTTQAAANGVSLEIAVVNVGSVASSSWFDTLILRKDSETTYVWCGAVPNQYEYWGMVRSGVRVPFYTNSSNTYPGSIADGYFSAPIDSRMFYFRRDAGAPGSCDVGVRETPFNSNSKNYLKVDGLDFYGPGGTSTTLYQWHSTSTARSFINVHDSDHITIQNGVVSFFDWFGIYVYNTASNVTLANLSVHDCGNTQIYHNASGTISGCTVYNSGLCATDDGADKGGIGRGNAATDGAPTGALTITQNEVYNIGLDTASVDGGISLVGLGTGVEDPVTISRNYIHDIPNVAIQISMGFNSSQITNNIINHYGYTSAGATQGHQSGIRIGGGTGPAPTGVQIYNNVLKGGSQLLASTINAGLLIENEDVSNMLVKNNIFYLNTCKDVVVITGATTTGVVFTNNLYYKVDLTTNWRWKGTNCDTLAAWRTASNLTETGSLTADPRFVNASGTYSLATDFKLQSGSLAINTGTDVGLTTDYEGADRPQ